MAAMFKQVDKRIQKNLNKYKKDSDKVDLTVSYCNV